MGATLHPMWQLRKPLPRRAVWTFRQQAAVVDGWCHSGGALAWSARPTMRSDDRRDGIDQWETLRHVVGMGRRAPDRQRDAGAVDNQVVRGAGFAAVGRNGAGLLALLLARTLRLSTLARDQSMAVSSPSHVSSVVGNRVQTPASCQSRSRRQQVAPLPQPSALGRSRHGQPVRRTTLIPARAAQYLKCGSAFAATAGGIQNERQELRSPVPGAGH